MLTTNKVKLLWIVFAVLFIVNIGLLPSFAAEVNNDIINNINNNEIILNEESCDHGIIDVSDKGNPEDIQKWKSCSIPVSSVNSIMKGFSFNPNKHDLLTYDREIEKLTNQVIHLYDIYDKTNNINLKNNINNQIANINNHLEKDLGVNILDAKELAVLFGNNNETLKEISTDATLPDVPPTDSNNYWYSYGPFEYSKNGNTYNVFVVRVKPRSNSSVLQDYYPFVTIRDTRGNWLNIVGEIYIQKVIGKIKYVEWTPYELLWEIGEPVSSSDEGQYYALSTVLRTNETFYFVNGYGNPYYDLSLCASQSVSNNVRYFEWFDSDNNLHSSTVATENPTQTTPYYYYDSSSFNKAIEYYDSAYYGYYYTGTYEEHTHGPIVKQYEIPFERYIGLIY